jgi:hypothetical protein
VVRSSQQTNTTDTDEALSAQTWAQCSMIIPLYFVRLLSLLFSSNVVVNDVLS